MNTSNHNDELKYLTAKETAAFLGVSKLWLIRNRKSLNAIPFKKITGRVFYEKTKIIESMEGKRRSKKSD